MTNERVASWPRDLVILRWVFMIASVACLVQAVSLFRAPRRDLRPDIGMYYGAVVLVLTCASCAAAWAKKLRAFVALALVSQIVNVFMTVFYMMYGASALVELGGVALPHMLPGTLWNMLVFAFAMAVVLHLVRRYVSIAGVGDASELAIGDRRR